MAHLEVEPKPPRPWWPWILLILIILAIMAWLYKVYNREGKDHLLVGNLTAYQSENIQLYGTGKQL